MNTSTPSRILALPVTLLLLASPGSARPLPPPVDSTGTGWSLVRLDADVTVLPSAERLTITGTATLRNEARPSLGPSIGINSRTALFRFTEATGPDDATLELNAPLEGRSSVRMINIRFPEAKLKGSEIDVSFSLRSRGRSMQFAVSDEIALASWTEGWLPLPRPREGESLSGKSAAPGTTRFHLPEGWRSVSNGRRVRREAHEEGVVETWEITVPVARSFCAAPFTVGTELVGEREVGIYLLPRDEPPERSRQRARDQAVMLSRALEAMEARFGPYPYPTTAIAEVPEWVLELGWGASSEQGFVMARRGFFHEGGNLPLFAHEAAHAWWGNLVATTGPGSILCSEGLAQYGAVLAIETLEGREAATDFLRFSRDEYIPEQCAEGYFHIVRRGEDRPLSELGNGGINHTLADAKGHWVLHMLRRRIGDEIFFSTLRGLIRDHGGRSMTLDDLRQAFLDTAPEGAHLERFLGQWLDRIGAPILEATVVSSTAEETVVSVRQLQEGPPYDLRLDLELESDGDKSRHTVALTEKEESFTLPGRGKTVAVRIDPDHELLLWTDAYGPVPRPASSAPGSPTSLTLPSALTDSRPVAGTWSGAVRLPHDTISIVLHFEESADGWSATYDLPNQSATGRPVDRIRLDGDRLTFRPLRDETTPIATFEGTINGGLLGGDVINSTGAGDGSFHLVRVADVTAADLARLDGTYDFGDGSRLRIRHVPRLGDPVLSFTDPVTGTARWAFPVSENEFVAGPEQEVPSPVETVLLFEPASAGSPACLVWQRQGAPLRKATKRGPAARKNIESDSPLVGRWIGTILLAGRTNRTVIRIEPSGNELTGVMDLPDMTLADRPFRELVHEDGAVRLSLDDPVLGRGVFTGHLDGPLLVGSLETRGTDGVSRNGQFAFARVVNVDRASLRSRTGDYDVEGLGRVKIELVSTPAGDLLEAYALAANTIPMHPVSDTEFVAGLDPTEDDPVSARFVFTPGSRDFKVHRGGAVLSGTRLADRLQLDEERIGRRIERMRREMDVPSYSVGIVHGDELIYSRSFGQRDLETKEPATETTLYQIGSLTKTFTATALLILRDEGKVRLDDPVEIHLPKSNRLAAIDEPPRQRITLRRIATHTAGLPRDPVNRVNIDGVMAPYTVEHLYEGFPSTGLAFPPGERWSYSNLGYGILGHILARTAGVPFETLIRERILEPLSMSDTTITLSEEDAKRFATHYWPSDRPRRARPRWEFAEIAGGGGLLSNVVDLAKYLSFQFRSNEPDLTPLSAASLRELHTPIAQRNGPSELIGLGWWVDQSPERGTVISHGGEVDGHSCHVAFSPVHRVGIIVLANLGGNTAYVLGDWLIQEAIEQTRERTTPRSGQAELFSRQRQWGDSAWANRAVVQANPRNGAACYRLGLACFYLRRYDEARTAFVQALDMGHSPGTARYMIARLEAIRGNVEASAEQIRQAISAGFQDFDRLEREPELVEIRRRPEIRRLLRSVGRENE